MIEESLRENPEEFITEGRIKDIIIRKETKLSGVSNEQRNIQSYTEVTNIAAEVKKKAKAAGTSIFVVDQRKV